MTMRRWFIILLTSVGITSIIFLNYKDPITQHAGIADLRVIPDTGDLDAAAPPSISIHAVVSVDLEAFSKLEEATERFEALRPNVKVTLTNVSADEMDAKYRRLLFAGEGPDVMLYPTAWVRHEAAEGRLLALDNYVAMERQSQWFETVRGAVRWNGYLWGVPVEWDPYVFVFPTASVQSDDPAETVDPHGDLWALLNDSEIQQAGYGAAILTDWSSMQAAAMEEAEASAPSDDSEKADTMEPEAAAEGVTEKSGETADLEAEASVAAAAVNAEPEAAALLAAETHVEPEEPLAPQILLGEQGESGKAMEAVMQGEAASAFVPLNEAILFASEHRGQMLSAAIPSAPEGAAVTLPPFLGTSFVVSPTTAHPEEAADWIQFVTDPSIVEGGTLHTEQYWPVYRSYYGFAATASSNPKDTDKEPTAPLPSVSNLFGREMWFSARSIMRLWDESPAVYGAPPAELPHFP